jgi:Cu2+-exporting ATPase
MPYMTAAQITALPDSACFHCGLPLRGRSYSVVIGGREHVTCCRGCQAVANMIAGRGLGAYYRRRSALPPRAGEADTDLAARYAAYDLPQVQQGYVRECGGTEREAALLLEGVTCAACLWLIEQCLRGIDGVRQVSMNFAARRVQVRWDSAQLKLSAILSAISSLGYRAQLYDPSRSETLLAAERRTLLWRLFVAAFGMMQVMMYAVPVYIADGEMPRDIERLMQFASLALTLPVIAWSALPFYTGAWRGLRARRINMDAPVALGILSAFAASAVAVLRGGGAVYFDSISMFVFLLLGSRFLELEARTRAARAQDHLLRLVPATAERLCGGAVECVPAALLRPGDCVLVKPGEAIPADGVVTTGASSCDESLLTGESRAIPKRVGDRLIAGAVNHSGVLEMRVEKSGADTALAGITRLMDRALSEKPRLAALADRAAGYFSAALLIIAAATAAVWYVIDYSRVFEITLALLVITCPCALALATPTALTAATGALQRSGVLLTRGHALETLAHATHFVFDKTGTLTGGRMTLMGVFALGGENREQCLAYARALEAASEHPVAHAILEAAAPPMLILCANEPRNFQGKGMEGIVDGRRMRIGSAQFVAELHGLPAPDDVALISDDVVSVVLGDEHDWIALFTLGDPLRRDARRVVRALEEGGSRVCMLSGDREAHVLCVAEKLGISEAYGAATPALKLDHVRALQSKGAVVAMIGDGVNDAPVLAQAQVSIALGSGTALAQTAADVVLYSASLQPLLSAVYTARRTMRIIHQNLAWALVYNLVAVPLALSGHVTPLAAAAGMSISSLLVVANALRLMRVPRGVNDPAASRLAV